jgi:hypothetical protein
MGFLKGETHTLRETRCPAPVAIFCLVTSGTEPMVVTSGAGILLVGHQS